MCECNTYLYRKDKEEEVMKNVASIKAENGKIHLVDILGQTRDINAEIKEVRFLEHKVILEKKSHRKKSKEEPFSNFSIKRY